MNTLSITYYTTKKLVTCFISLKTNHDDMFDMAAYELELSEDGFKSYEVYSYVREDVIDTTLMQEDELFQESLVWDNKYDCNFDFLCLIQKEMKRIFDNYPVKRLSTGPEQYRRILFRYED
ncbi:hypothetical protein ACQ29_gp180 [Escherichia phage PBECO4]|uniref:Uncharacterized protein n=1 Tax=Escherichia phage PBECO4 TaxID=1273738 RepID=L7TPK4_9CAUD|nr:hypothetical protein ACQ29_gp180 [Escherichia phage PBECO4]AGC34860.1 hypothetical protein [Escherichia phage PBECO4]